MSVPSATANAPAEQVYPVVKYAAVQCVQYARTDDHHPEARWKRGGVMLVEVFPGKFAIFVTGSQYHATVDHCNITARMDIIPDIKHREIRWSRWVNYPNTVKSWTYVRFETQRKLTKFIRELFAAFDVVSERDHLINTRIFEIGFDTPSNFTKYCRQYLGQDYFDNLMDSEDSESDGAGSSNASGIFERSDDRTVLSGGDSGY